MKNDKQKIMTYISLFSSAGVGCYGFSMEDFECIATVELISRRLKVQEYNNICKYKTGYIGADIIKPSTKEKIIDEIDFWKSRHELKDVDVVISTPPCQGMSVANHKKRNELGRNSLVVESIQLVDKIRPKIFIFENVRSFLSTQCTDTDGKDRAIREAIELNLGGKYNIHFQVINFKDYGNPSSRTRTLVIGVRKDIQEVTPLELLPPLKYGGTIRDTIADLPSLKTMGEIDEKDIYHNFRPYKKNMLSWIKDIHEGESAFDNKDPKKRPHKIIDGKIIHNENKNGDKYSRCYWDKSAPCIHTRNDILASQSTIHPSDNRVFSIRELMKLMSVPSTFRWTDINEKELNVLSTEQKQKFLKKNEINIRQSLGEAVPTIIFHGLAKNIKSLLNQVKISESEINKLIHTNQLSNPENLKTFLSTHLVYFSFSELSKIIELSNSQRSHTSAYYTRQDICFTLIKDLPDASKYEYLKILEPSVGSGSFLPLLIEKYKTVRLVEIDLVDIDNNTLEALNIIIKKIDVPANIKFNFINQDFLLFGDTNLFSNSKHYDIVIGNPPFGNITANKNLLDMYKKNLYNLDTNNLFSFFLEKAHQLGDVVGFIVPKSFLSAPEFNKTRELVSNFAIKKITDYGEKAFKGVKIETISLVVDTKHRGGITIIESYINNVIETKDQNYICSKSFPYWLVYRNDFFDRVAKRLRFNIFSTYRDRQITKKITKQSGAIRVLKSRNIGNNKIVDIQNYDTFVDNVQGLSIAKFINQSKSVLVPNLTYNPRACFMPKDVIVDGSVAILTPKDREMVIKVEDLNYFSTEEFSDFYKIARNYGTRSLNIDNNSVFFFGLQKQNYER